MNLTDKLKNIGRSVLGLLKYAPIIIPLTFAPSLGLAKDYYQGKQAPQKQVEKQESEDKEEQEELDVQLKIIEVKPPKESAEEKKEKLIKSNSKPLGNPHLWYYENGGGFFNMGASSTIFLSTPSLELTNFTGETSFLLPLTTPSKKYGREWYDLYLGLGAEAGFTQTFLLDYPWSEVDPTKKAERFNGKVNLEAMITPLSLGFTLRADQEATLPKEVKITKTTGLFKVGVALGVGQKLYERVGRVSKNSKNPTIYNQNMEKAAKLAQITGNWSAGINYGTALFYEDESPTVKKVYKLEIVGSDILWGVFPEAGITFEEVIAPSDKIYEEKSTQWLGIGQPKGYLILLHELKRHQNEPDKHKFGGGFSVGPLKIFGGYQKPKQGEGQIFGEVHLIFPPQVISPYNAYDIREIE